MTIRIIGGQFTVHTKWVKSSCDRVLYYTTNKKLGWHYFGLVCTKNHKYVWGLANYNFGESTKDAKEKLLKVCAEDLTPILAKVEII